MPDALNDLSYIMLCTDLGLLPENVPPNLKLLLESKLEAAKSALSSMGVATYGGPFPDESAADRDLLVLYAAWLYRSRVQQQPMPAMLQRRIHNRQVTAATQKRLRVDPSLCEE